MSDYSKVKVGDTIWFTDVNRGGVTEATVERVGPKLIAVVPVGHQRSTTFRKDTGCTNDAYGHQRLILDLELHAAENLANEAFRLLKMGLNFKRNFGVTVADIHIATKALKIKL